MATAVAVSLNASFKTVRVEGASMTPTLQPGQYMLLAKKSALSSSVKDGDIVVIDHWKDHDFIVKRVYRLAGEVVDPIETPISYWGKEQLKPYYVPKGCVYVLGDNSKSSEDSRIFGPVPMSHIVGKVLMH